MHFADYNWKKKHGLIFNSTESIMQELPKRVDNGIKTKRFYLIKSVKIFWGDQSGKLIKSRANFNRNPGDKWIFRCFRSFSHPPMV